MQRLNAQYDISDNVYVNVVFRNTNTDETPQIASINETRTLPILGDCSQYYCSIIKFDIPLNSIPLYILPITTGTTNITTLIIGITTSAGVDYPFNVIYVPDNNLPTTDPKYYFVYNYQNLILALNTALLAAYTAAGNPGTTGFSPFFYYDSATQLIHLVVSPVFITAGATIFWNNSTENYLEAFPVKFLGYNQMNGKDFVYIYNTTANFEFPIPPTTPQTFFDFPQEYQILEYWSSLRKILIVTDNIPILSEFAPGKFQQSVSNSIPIITDFTPSVEKGQDSRSIAYYTPSAQYRLVDMISTRPLQDIDLKILWEDKSGNVYPLYISQYQEANIKIAFLKKSLYKQTHLLIK